MKIVVNECEDNQQILLRTSINNDKKTPKENIAEESEIKGICEETPYIHVLKSKHRTFKYTFQKQNI